MEDKIQVENLIIKTFSVSTRSEYEQTVHDVIAAQLKSVSGICWKSSRVGSVLLNQCDLFIFILCIHSIKYGILEVILAVRYHVNKCPEGLHYNISVVVHSIR